jgi:hypothetical protein
MKTRSTVLVAIAAPLVISGSLCIHHATIDEGPGIRQWKKTWITAPWQGIHSNLEAFNRSLRYGGEFSYTSAVLWGVVVVSGGGGNYGDRDQSVGMTHLTRMAEVPTPAPGVWGETVDGLRLALLSREATRHSGEPFELVVLFNNTRDTTLSYVVPYDVRDEPGLWVLDVKGPRGNVLYRGDYPVYPLTLDALKPGESRAYAFKVDEPVWVVSPPGSYSFTFKYSEEGPATTNPTWRGTLRSNEVSISRTGEPF